MKGTTKKKQIIGTAWLSRLRVKHKSKKKYSSSIDRLTDSDINNDQLENQCSRRRIS